ncbi:zinc-dependent alcohol dehydrogenase family protein [Undibacterium sp.]|uniref:zinc-dependent alcohol dehydrogenase family protein n=1 Tax=Undibacterium sp. TaxID=1914977 RepID=UPI002C49B595|nr:zinc-dependent alcohol dehydrogenase family protein [Undibacterium sp.]HTD05710.1 zinc-dependent alcohol dehydrogenase family protein [Undibacterium sp.]
MSNPASMRALILEAYGNSFVAREVVRPAPAKGEVLVRIHASGVNPLDTKIRSGNAAHAKTVLPAILGMDLAGVVEAVGADVGNFRAGDEVFGMTGGIAGVPGSLAEFAAVDAALLALKPANLDMREAAALPLIFITAWEGLVDRANVQPGQKVLVHGGAGGVGHIAVQLAHALGADVYATGSAAQKEIIEGYGATAIDYKSMTVEEYVAAYTGGEGFDVVYDTVGGATLDASFEAARTYGGHVVSCLGWGTHKLAPLSFRAATYSGVFTLLPLITGKGRAHHGDILREAGKLAEAGKLKPLMDHRQFTMETAVEAHALVESGAAHGKIAINIA